MTSVLTSPALAPAPDLAAQARFAATVSHEIRTPLNGILGMAALLEETNLTPSQREYVRAIRASGGHLLDLLNSVLDFTRLDAGDLLIEEAPFSPQSVAQDVAELMAPRAHARSLDIAASMAADVPPLLLGDAGRIRQILFNLVGNAIKFTDTGGVLIRVEMNGTQVRFCVRDTGPGLTPEQAARCFEAFNQSRASDAARDSGVGLGLAIVMALARAMGGQAGVISSRTDPSDAQASPHSLGSGACFYVDLPLRTVQAPPISNARKAVLPTFESVVYLRGLSSATAWTVTEALAAEGIVCETDDLARNQSAKPENTGSRIALLAVDAPPDAWSNLTQFSGVIVTLRPEDRAAMPGLLARGATGFLIRPIRTASLLARLKGQSLGAAEVNTETMGEEPWSAEAKPVATGTPVTRRALVADDNPINGLLARKALEAVGWSVDVVANGAEALEMAMRQRFDMIVMDIRMPVLDGLAATRAVRSQSGPNQHTPIIAASAHLDPDIERACREVGVSRCAMKPLDPMRLRDLAASLINQPVTSLEGRHD
jgi:CheY-like chemotaxis protein